MTDHDIHGDDASTNDIIAVAEILSEHRGSDNPVTSGEIADKTGLDSLDSTPRTRGVIRKLSRQYDFPIGASTKGYFLIERRGEAQEYLDDLDGRIQGIEQRKNAVVSSINRRGVADGAAVDEWVDDVREEVNE